MVKRFIVPRAFRTVKGFSREGWGFGAKEAVRAASVFPSRARSAAEEAGAATASSAALHSYLAKVLACREDFLGSPNPDYSYPTGETVFARGLSDCSNDTSAVPGPNQREAV